MKKTILAALLALLAASTVPARAGSLIEVAVISRATGQRLAVWNHQGRLYVAGTPGEKYSVLVSNRRRERVLAVVSVDGINVITGETAAPGQSGYVLEPRGRVDIHGWRKSLAEVAAFLFTALPDSYATRTGRPGSVGVIGVAVFREARPARIPQSAPIARSDAPRAEAGGAGSHDSAAADSSRALSKSQEKLGTGHGERETSEARWTHFLRASERPHELVSIYYDSRANLLARGIIPGRPRIAEPNPFPGFRFAPDPSG